MEQSLLCWKFWFGPQTFGLLVKDISRLKKILHWKNSRPGQLGSASLPWHKSFTLEALTDSNARLKLGLSKIKVKRVLFRNSCHAKPLCSLFLIWRNWAEMQSYYVCFINLLCLLNLICKEFQSITRSTDVSSWQPVISVCSKVIFLLDSPCKRFEIHHLTISHFMPACYFRSRN